MNLLVVVLAVKVIALLWYLWYEVVYMPVSQLNTLLGGTQLQTPLNGVLLTPENGLLVLLSFVKEAFSFGNFAALFSSLYRLALGLQQQGCRTMKRRVMTSRKHLLVVKGLLLNSFSFASATPDTWIVHQGGAYKRAPNIPVDLIQYLRSINEYTRLGVARPHWKDLWTVGAVATAALGAVAYYYFYPVEFNEDRVSRERLRQYMQEQGPDDVSAVEAQVPPVYSDLQDYSRNHRRDSDDEDELPVLDPAYLRRLEDESINEHRVLCGEQDPDYIDGEVKLFSESGLVNRNTAAMIAALTATTAVFTKVAKPKHAIIAFAGMTSLANFAFAEDPSKERTRRRLVRRRRKVARKLKTCLYIRAYVRSRLTPESLRVKTSEDGEISIDAATSCLVDRMLQEFFKIHCWNMQSIAEYQDLARVVVFYTNDDLGIARSLEPRLGQSLTR